MGDYRLPEKTATVEFDEYPGLEIVVRTWPVDMETYFRLVTLLDEWASRTGLASLVAGARELAEILGPHLVSWGFADEPNREGLLRQPWELVSALAVQWANAVAGVPDPLARLSGSGGPSAEPQASRSQRRSQRRSSAKRR